MRFIKYLLRWSQINGTSFWAGGLNHSLLFSHKSDFIVVDMSRFALKWSMIFASFIFWQKLFIKKTKCEKRQKKNAEIFILLVATFCTLHKLCEVVAQKPKINTNRIRIRMPESSYPGRPIIVSLYNKSNCYCSPHRGPHHVAYIMSLSRGVLAVDMAIATPQRPRKSARICACAPPQQSVSQQKFA